VDAADAALDNAAWGTWGSVQTMQQAVDRIRNEFLPARRTYLYNTQTVGSGGEIPTAQPNLAALSVAQRKVTFGTIDYAPASGNQDEEYLQLVNSNTFAVDISGWQL